MRFICSSFYSVTMEVSKFWNKFRRLRQPAEAVGEVNITERW